VEQLQPFLQPQLPEENGSPGNLTFSELKTPDYHI
jgi:hypothetical protein